jgi:FHA domain
MDKARNFFLNLIRKCCPGTEVNRREPLEDEKKNTLEATTTNIANYTDRSEKDPLKLILVVIESEKIQIGKEYFITSAGLVNSERNTSGDGYVFAGCLYYDHEEVVNDIILPQNEKGVGKRHFMIHYKKKTGFYCIKDLGDGMGTFIKLTRPLVLENKFIVSFGDSHMIITIENNDYPEISLKFIDGPKVNQKL